MRAPADGSGIASGAAMRCRCDDAQKRGCRRCERGSLFVTCLLRARSASAFIRQRYERCRCFIYDFAPRLMPPFFMFYVNMLDVCALRYDDTP